MNRVAFLNNLASKKVKYNLGAGVPPLNLFSELQIEKCIKVFQKEYPDIDVFHYHQSGGVLSEIVKTYFNRNDDITFHPDLAIATTSGVQEAITIATTLFKNEAVACFDPYYPGFVDVVKTFGKNPVLLSPVDWENQISKLPERTLIYLSTDFSNPSGNRLSLDQRIKMIELAQKHNLFIFDDATYREYYLDKKLPALISLDNSRVIHAASFSKILSPGLRMAFVLLPKEFESKFLAIKANVSLNSSGISQAILGGWLISNAFNTKKHLARAIERLKNNQHILREYKIKYDGGFFARMDLKRNISLDWCNELLANDIAVCPMSLFSDNKENNNEIRLAISNISDMDLNQAIKKIINFANQ